MNLFSRKAFTLAEVLITLGVIGVVAAMTLPTLIKNYQKKVTVERLKTVYSTISQAVKMSEIENGPISDWDLPSGTVYNYAEVRAFSEKYLEPYLKNVKKCDGSRVDCFGECMYLLNGKKFGSSESETRYYLVLNNSSVINPVLLGGQRVVILLVDINGSKGPNMSGKDNFSIIIATKALNNDSGITSSAGVYMRGYGLSKDKLKTDKNNGCSKDKSILYAGTYCGAWIMHEGWKIPDDYPW